MLGPREAEDVIDVTQQVSAKGGTLLLTPTSTATAIAYLADADLTWRAAPSDSQRANLVIAQMNALEDEDVGDAALAEEVGERSSRDAGADDDDIVHEGVRSRESGVGRKNPEGEGGGATVS